PLFRSPWVLLSISFTGFTVLSFSGICARCCFSTSDGLPDRDRSFGRTVGHAVQDKRDSDDGNDNNTTEPQPHRAGDQLPFPAVGIGTPVIGVSCWGCGSKGHP